MSNTGPIFASDADALVAVVICVALAVAVVEIIRDRLTRDRLKIRRRR